MGTTPPGLVTLRYWAAARSAAGADTDEVAAPVSLAEATAEAVRRHGDRLGRVLAVCSVLVDDRPVTTATPEELTLHPGQSVEFLPPFAGG